MTKETFPNPLEMLIGNGDFEISSFKDADGLYGILFRESPHRRAVGNVCPKMEFPHNPEPGEVYVRFANLNGAIIVMEALSKVMTGLAGFPPLPEEQEKQVSL